VSRDAIVFQSAPESHAPWVDAALSSVERWAARHGAEYWLLPDQEFFASVPEWVLRKSTTWINPVTDLARLLVARELIRTRSTAIWVDADVLIWAPDHLPLPKPPDAAFSGELWMERWPNGRLRFLDNVSNFVCAFSAQGAFLDTHIAEVLNTLRKAPEPMKLGVAGTALLTRGYDHGSFELITGVANFSPVLTHAIAAGWMQDVKAFEERLGCQLAAANLCLSHEARPFQGRAPSAEVLPKLVRALSGLSQPLRPTELVGQI
jgi:hypothetical protein